MPDYCMCKGDDCTQRDKCFRYRAISDPYRQSYFAEVPGTGNECEHFMTVKGWPERMLKLPETPPEALPETPPETLPEDITINHATREERVIDAINFLVANTSVSRYVKIESLLEIQNHIDFLSDILDKDV